MISKKEKEGWHNLLVKRLLALLHVTTSKRKGDFYCLNCLHSFRTENNLKSHKEHVKIKIFVEL